MVGGFLWELRLSPSLPLSPHLLLGFKEYPCLSELTTDELNLSEAPAVALVGRL